MIVLKRISVLIILIAAFVVSLPAQTIKETFAPAWPSPATNTDADWFCEDCLRSSDNPDLPVFVQMLAFEKRLQGPVKLLNIVTEEVQDFPAELSHFVPAQFNLEVLESVSNKKVHNNLSIIPLRFNINTKKVERLISFEAEYTLQGNNDDGEAEITSQTKNKKKSGSLLATGHWYKVGVTRDGVYKLTLQNLQQMGFAAGSVDPRNIKVYGYGGGMLPMTNKPENLDEMQEIPVFIKGEQDGKFDPEDYLLFYAGGPHTWNYNENTGRYAHQLHYYSDTIFYFITAATDPGKRIEIMPSSTATPEYTTNTYDALLYHEPEEHTKINDAVKSGKDWFGEEFDIITQRDYNFTIPAIDASVPVYVKTVFGARSRTTSRFNLRHNGVAIIDSPVPSVNLIDYTKPYLNEKSAEGSFTSSTESITLKLTYQKSDESRGWLNYIRLNARAYLDYRNQQIIFSDKNSIDKVSQYNITNAADLFVWEVGDQHNIKQVMLAGSGNQKHFIAPAGPLKKYAAFTHSSAPAPILKGKIANQDLRNMADVDMLIITVPHLLSEAMRLAEHRKNYSGINISIVTPQEIYNEFSAGTQDIVAIRDFVKYLHDNATSPEKALKYLLMFGDASYDYKDRIKDNTNYVPTYQGIPIYMPQNSIATDDFFGILKDGEGDLHGHGSSWNSFTIDIGVGRIPAHTQSQAAGVVDKIIRYETEPDLGDWKNILTFLSDDEDKNAHIRGNEYLSAIVSANYPVYNQKKIIMDTYPQETTSSGQSYPGVKKEINNRINAGCLVFNYMGHGGENGLAHERVVEIPDILGWSNYKKLPLFVTATCEFSRFDDPKRIAAGEYVLFNNKGGAIAMLTTTRIAYVGGNEQVTKNLFNVLFKPINGEMPTLGQVYMYTKNNTRLDLNSIIFALLGDPSMKLAYPAHQIATTAINGVDISAFEDTLKALSFVTIQGEVQDAAGQILNSFNGSITPTIFDKPGSITTLGQDPESYKQTYQIQENIIYKGKATVKNGKFSFSFVVPKDINYRDGFGKISYYAENGSEDGHGLHNVMIGGTSDSAIVDDNPPIVKLYMNDTTFMFGGLTNENPYLYAVVEDDYGINTTGNAIGHDITAVLDDGPAIVLNSYYESEENNHRKGIIKYPFSDLSEGHHTLRLKVWDVANNSADAYTEFIVSSSAKLALQHLMNYPNPVSDYTKFSVEHNKHNEAISIEISIFDLSGNIITTLKKEYPAGTTRINDMEWDGKNNNGHTIASGLYVYKLILRTSDGEIATASQKLVLLK